jgi:DNA modification methylase
LDPFAGCGTSLVAAAERGLCGIGYDPHPIFSRICRAKFPTRDTAFEVREVRAILTEGFRHPVALGILSISQRAFLTKLFPIEVLEALLGARRSLQSSVYAESDIAFLILSLVADKCCHSQTDGIYKAPTSKKCALEPEVACEETVYMIEEDLASLNGADFLHLAQIFAQSSQSMNQSGDDSASIAVTSPPYLNNFDFAEMTRMLLYFWGLASSWGEITDKVRRPLIVNTTTALKGHKAKQDKYRSNLSTNLLPALDEIVANLAKRKLEKNGKKDYDQLVYPYFSQMTDVLRESFRVLRRGAPIHIVVADAALYGVHVSTPQFLQEAMEEIGFQQVECDLLRARGHRWTLAKREGSAFGLGEYHLHGVK